MALFKKENHEHLHTHVSKDAAKEIRKGQEAMAVAQKEQARAQRAQAEALEAQADALEAQAMAELKAVQEQEYTKRYIADQELNREERGKSVEEFKKLAELGTYEAYVKLVGYRDIVENEKGMFNFKLEDNSGARASEKDIAIILRGFNYTKDINEFQKIVKYAIQKSYMDDLRIFLDIVELNMDKPGYTSLHEEIDRVVNPTIGNVFSNVKKAYSELFKSFSLKKK
ncbi:MAG: hypothetical protein IJB01_10495 [Bacteroidaceae bacterium]|nr:hypothetical protein [Bacteroidaceae bacterium]